MQKKQYVRPSVIEYGRLRDLTAGSSGPHLDFTWNGSVLTISNACPKTQFICVKATS